MVDDVTGALGHAVAPGVSAAEAAVAVVARTRLRPVVSGRVFGMTANNLSDTYNIMK